MRRRGPTTARSRRPAGLRRLTDHRRGVAARAAAPGRRHRRAGRPGSAGDRHAGRPADRGPDLAPGDRGLLDPAGHPGAAGDHPGLRRSSGAVGRRLHLVVAGQQRTPRGGAELRRRHARSCSPTDCRRRRSRRTGTPSARSTPCWPRAGLSGDHHGATAPHPAFSRTNAQWRAAGREWMSAPREEQGRRDGLAAGGRSARSTATPGLPAVDPGLLRRFAAITAPCACCCRSRCPIGRGCTRCSTCWSAGTASSTSSPARSCRS